jgi:hypothetical protein
MNNSKAIVTLAVGKKYLDQWRRLCQSNWQKYADQHGYDLICIDTPLDNSERAQKRSPAWQKCLVLSQGFSQKYERIVWIDSDILINCENAPCITAGVPVDEVGAVNEWATPSPDLYALSIARRNEYFKLSEIDYIDDITIEKFYKNCGLSPKIDGTVQTGVMVLSPKYHRHILEKVYYEYEDKGASKWNYEMRPLSWELLEARCVHWIDYRFNLTWLDYISLHYPFLLKPSPKLTRKMQSKLHRLSLHLGISFQNELRRACANVAFMNSFFLHFAGSSADQVLVDTTTTSWRNLKI